MTVDALHILSDANKAYKDRMEKYGKPDENFELISSFWDTYLQSKGLETTFNHLNSMDVAMMLMLVKIARLASGDKFHHDSIVDIAGYAQCYADCAEVEEATNG